VAKVFDTDIDCASRLKILAVEARLAVVRRLMKGECTVSEMLKSPGLEIEQSLLSHHLKVLRVAKFVEFRQQGKSRLYRLSDNAATSLRRGKLDLGCCSIDFKS
jgi:ArsR family transcriptional regulator